MICSRSLAYLTHNAQRCQDATWTNKGQTVIKWEKDKMKPTNFYIDRNNYLYFVDKSNEKVFIWTTYSNKPSQIVKLEDKRFRYVYIDGNQTTFFHKCEKRFSKEKSVVMVKFDRKILELFIHTDGKTYCTSKDFGKDKFQKDSPKNSWSPGGILLKHDFHVFLIHSDHVDFLDSDVFIGEELEKKSSIENRYGETFFVDKGKIFECFSKKCQCFIGCGEKNELTGVRFDIYGNLFVLDEENHRLQKYELEKNSCCKLCSRSRFIVSFF